MGRISASTGLVTGFPIASTVSQLVQLESGPVNHLKAQNTTLGNQQTALTQIEAQLIAVQSAAKNLGQASLYNQRSITSSNPTVLTATPNTSGTPPQLGNYAFTPLQQAQGTQLQSSAFASDVSPLAAGTLTFGFGGFIDSSVPLSLLNGGNSVTPGKIQITDRSGATALVDLTAAQTIGDVVQAINSATGIHVQAQAVGDHLLLTDTSGSTSSNLKVQDVGTGTTAATLGLAGINAAASSASGSDLLTLFNNLPTSSLNDGLGVRFDPVLPDAKITLSDGTEVNVTLHKQSVIGTFVTGTTDAAQGANAAITFTARQAGAQSAAVTVSFVDDPSVTAGNEKVTYDSHAKTLVFKIEQGKTTANDVIAALNRDPTASAAFSAQHGPGGDGTGLVTVSDAAVTTAPGGGAIIEPVPPGAPTTIGDILAAFNAAAPGKLSAQISSDGHGIKLNDLSGGSGSFTIGDLNGSHAVEDLGLGVAAAGSAINGTRVLAGLSTSLLKDLNGTAATSGLGTIDLTDRSGASATVDLSSAQTVDDVLSAINSAGIGIRATINSARNGIQLTDTTGSTAHNMTVANGDAQQTATKLGLAVDSAVSTDNSGDLGRRTVSENTKLASLNGGSGVAAGSFTITDSTGRTATVNVNSQVLTVGDLIQAIENTGLSVSAKINATGDGVEILDTAHAPGTLQVHAGSSTTAGDLHLLGAAATQTIGGQPTQVIDGSTTFHVAIAATDTLQSLVNKINGLGAGVTAAISNDGSGVNPFRFTLTSNSTGRASQILFDTMQAGFGLQQVSAGQDALLLSGTPGAGGFVASSSSNTFKGVLPGASVTVNGTSSSPVVLTVGASNSNLVTQIQAFVNVYNTLHTSLATDNSFDTTTNTGGVLQGDGNLLQVETNLTNILSGRLSAPGGIQSLAALGITIAQDGSLAVDTNKLQNAVSTNPQAVQQFFSTSGRGFSDKLSAIVDQLAGPVNSLLIGRIQAITDTIKSNQDRINTLNARLTADQTRLTTEFNNAEVAVAKMQSNLDALTAIQSFATIGGQIGGSTSLNKPSSSTGGSSSGGSVGSAFG